MENILHEVIDIRQILGKLYFRVPQAELLPGGTEAASHGARRQVVCASRTQALRRVPSAVDVGAIGFLPPQACLVMEVRQTCLHKSALHLRHHEFNLGNYQIPFVKSSPSDVPFRVLPLALVATCNVASAFAIRRPISIGRCSNSSITTSYGST